MTPDLDVPLWPLLLVAAGLFLLLWAVRRRERRQECVVVVVEDPAGDEPPAYVLRFDAGDAVTAGQAAEWARAFRKAGRNG